jgi:hypothetical protein
MPDLEAKLAAWRREAAAALPGRPGTVRELEEHLRDHIEVLTQDGIEPLVAFAIAAKQLGESGELAREFQQVRSRWFGAVQSKEIKFLAYVAGCLALAGLLLYGRLFFQVVNGKIPAANLPLALFFTGSISLVCAATVRVTGRFLQKPNVSDARSLIAFNLFAVWMLSGPVLGAGGVSYPIWVGLVLVVFVALIALWRAWTSHLDRENLHHV